MVDANLRKQFAGERATPAAQVQLLIPCMLRQALEVLAGERDRHRPYRREASHRNASPGTPGEALEAAGGLLSRALAYGEMDRDPARPPATGRDARARSPGLCRRSLRYLVAEPWWRGRPALDMFSAMQERGAAGYREQGVAGEAAHQVRIDHVSASA